MAQSSLEKRVTALELQLAQLNEKLAPSPTLPWWRQIAGTLTDDAALDEAMRLGREYRESLRPNAKRTKGGVKKNGNTRHRPGNSAGSKR
jgi:hypothetical protein